MCDRWIDDFAAFYADMGPRPSAEYSIERDDVNGNYEPGNCRWMENVEQQWNRRDTLYVEFRGEKIAIGRLAMMTGITR